jgi:hypothetical protein
MVSELQQLIQLYFDKLKRIRSLEAVGIWYF